VGRAIVLQAADDFTRSEAVEFAAETQTFATRAVRGHKCVVKINDGFY
jgi:hypothetical protein